MLKTSDIQISDIIRKWTDHIFRMNVAAKFYQVMTSLRQVNCPCASKYSLSVASCVFKTLYTVCILYILISHSIMTISLIWSRSHFRCHNPDPLRHRLQQTSECMFVVSGTKPFMIAQSLSLPCSLPSSNSASRCHLFLTSAIYMHTAIHML